MANILRRPMFRLGGQSSDGVGITSGFKRRSYKKGLFGEDSEGNPIGTEQMTKRAYDSSMDTLRQLRGMGKFDQYDIASMISNVAGKGGSIYDMVTNATEYVTPKFQDYKKLQASLGPTRSKIYSDLAQLGMGQEGLDIKRLQATKPLLPEVKTKMLVELGEWKQDKVESDGTWKNNDDYIEWQSRMNIIDSGFLTETEARLEASKIVTKLEAYEEAGRTKQAKMIQAWIDFLTGRSTSVNYAQGGRVGLQNSFPGTVEQASMAEQIQTPGGVEDITESEEVITEGQEGGPPGGPKQDPFVILRARLPQEITDDVVKLIAYNPDAFKDFAAIETQQDVINFNETYGVDLVLPTEQV